MTATNALPRWRGFNLLELFSRRGGSDVQSGEFREDDFRWIADWGFDFVRIPMDYRLWVEGDDVYALREDMLQKVDRVIRLGEQYGIHVSLNMHAAPGYCINNVPEPFDLWTDTEALDAFRFHWATFAQRYRDIPSDRLSFNLLNEPRVPKDIGGPEVYARVVRAATAAIREHDPERLVIADGIDVGRTPMPDLADLGIAQGFRAYDPMPMSHYRASWVNGSDAWPLPTWPQPEGAPGGHWDRARLEQHYAPWVALMESGIGVHCGEGGAHQFTPHEAFLAWFEDVLDILTGHGIGYALWNLRGTFGVLDSGRADVDYEDWHGHALDRKLLALMQRY
jgi:endoglucanase